MVIPNAKIDFQKIVRGVGAGLCLLDRHFHILWVNKYQADWFGLLKKICGTYCFRTFEHRTHICKGCPTVRVFKTGQIQSAQRIGITSDGKKRYYQLTVSPIKDNQNNVAFALELVQDITDKVMQERKSAQIILRLKRLYQHLARVNERLYGNVTRLKRIGRKMEHVKSAWSQKYHKKASELVVIKQELQDIFRLNRSIASTIDLKKLSSLIARLSAELTHADASVLRLLADDEKTLVVSSTYGQKAKLFLPLTVLKGTESVSKRAAKERKPIVIEQVNKDRRIQYPQLITQEGFQSILCVPLLFRHRVMGTVSVFSKSARHFARMETELLSIFASQITIALQEAKHYEAIHKNYFDTIHSLVLALEARDLYTRGHTERVTKYSLEIGRVIGLSESELELLRYASSVHDVGKIGIPDSILNKPGRLTPDERAVIELHPVKGAEVLEPLEFLRPVLPIVRHHHERYDGTGYPDGLERDKIPLFAKIIACADSFDAMTSERPYRAHKLTVKQALMEIKNNAGSQFDPYVAQLFIQAIRSKLPA